MAWHTPNDAGFDFETIGTNRRIPRKMDGISWQYFTLVCCVNI